MDVRSVQFGIMSDADILAISACKIDKSGLNEPGGVYDPRLGCTLNDVACATCGENVWKCSGHFGHIELTTPVIVFYKQVVVLLKCVCISCCRVLASKAELILNGVSGYDKTVNYLHSLSTCCHCQSPAPEIKYVPADSTIIATHKLRQNKASKILEPSFIKAVFDAIPPADVALLGLDSEMVHPSNYVWTKFPVLPTCCRPRMCAGDNICDDDLTLMLVEMLKANAYIQTHTFEADESAYTKAVETIRTRALAYCDNSRGKVTHNTNHKPMTGIKERINCKTGLVRQNLTGKRCDRTARTVIGPDPTLKLDQVAIPLEIANTLTLPEYVNPLTYDRLSKLVNEGKASTIIKPSGVKVNVHHARIMRGTQLKHADILIRDGTETLINDCKMELKSGDKIKRDGKIIPIKVAKTRPITLENGDIIERYLQDGDPIYLNRQPTLHRNSMLGMTVTVKPGKTIRFNLAVTKGLNADFDGDEGNIFCCESLTAAAEMIHLVSAKEHMLSAQTPKPEQCFVQDSLLAAYLMTSKPNPMSCDQFEQCLLRTNKYSLYVRGTDQMYAKDLFSYLMPSDFSYKSEKLVIHLGKIVSGYFDKSSLGSNAGAIVRLLRIEYDKHIAADFIDNMQFITNAWLEFNPFSIGLDDCLANQSALAEIKQTIDRCFLEAKIVHKNVFDPNIREVKINMALNKAKDLGLKIAKDALDPSNKIIDTVTSGSKGDFFNIAQITGLLGQQNLNNARPTPLLTNMTRTMIHYPYVITQADQQYESRGFVKSNFLNGLSAKESWFHAMTGREGMISTALKTASSGYIQRSCIKLNEDLRVEYDGTVRDARGGIHQFAYGNHGFDPSLVSSDLMPVDFDRLAAKLNCHSNESLRYLHQIEIENIIRACAFPNQTEIIASIWSKHEIKLRRGLESVQIASDKCQEFSATVTEKYILARACPGECVGIIGAQSIGEVQTQSNLNTFHTAGKLQTSGVDRFEELLRLTKTLKYRTMTVYFNQKFTTAEHLRETIGSNIVGLELENISKSVTILESDVFKYSIRFALRKSVIFSVRLYLDTIMIAIETTFADVECKCELMAIVVNVRYPSAKSRSSRKTKRDETTTDDIDQSSKRTLDGPIKQVINDLKKTFICGVPGITRMFVEKSIKGEFYIVTEGSNLKKMLAHPLVDKKRLYTNDVWETYECLGIAATKRMLIRDLKSCVSGVNDCHVRLLAEKMTYRGKPSSITRYTMRTNDVGPLSKATFEQSVDVIQTAAFRGEIDKLDGVSAALVTGNQVKVGTGMMDMMIDWEKFIIPDVYY